MSKDNVNEKVFNYDFGIYIYSFDYLLECFCEKPYCDKWDMLVVSLTKDQLQIETAESAKYLSGVEYSISKDTIQISVRITTVLNPFSDKKCFNIIRLDPEVNYIKIASVIKHRSEINTDRILFSCYTR